jgi:hypothetical protein
MRKIVTLDQYKLCKDNMFITYVDIRINMNNETFSVFDVFENVELCVGNNTIFRITNNLMRISNEMGLEKFDLIKNKDELLIRIFMYKMFKLYKLYYNKIIFIVEGNFSYENEINLGYGTAENNKIIELNTVIKEYMSVIKQISTSYVCNEDVIEKNISFDLSIPIFSNYMIIWIKCSKCQSICQCEYKVHELGLTLGRNNIEIFKYEPEILNKIYPMIHNDFITNCDKMSKNIFFYPFCKMNNYSTISLLHESQKIFLNVIKMYKNDEIIVACSDDNIIKFACGITVCKYST